MSICVDGDKRGYSVMGITTADINDVFGYDKKIHKNYFYRKFKAKDYYFLVDRLCVLNDDVRVVLKGIEDVSKHWWTNVMSSLVQMIVRRYMTFLLNPQHYGGYGNYIFAANYTQLKNYLERIIKVLIKNYNFENRLYKLNIKRPKLIKLSELWTINLLPEAEKLLPHYHRKMKTKL